MWFKRYLGLYCLALVTVACNSQPVSTTVDILPTVSFTTPTPDVSNEVLGIMAAPDPIFSSLDHQLHSSVLLDDFDSHSWTKNSVGLRAAKIGYSNLRNTQGENALHIQTPFDPDPDDLNDNTVRIDVMLPEPEDWSGFETVTLDIYMAENPTGLAEAKLYLVNSEGQYSETMLILGWQLFQWENYQMTFPLKGNTHIIAPIPDEILRDVTQVGLALTRFSDTGFGEPYEELNFYLDNMRLDGAAMWDTFDGPKWNWLGRDVGITHNQRVGHGGASLRFVGQTTGRPATELVNETSMQAVTAVVQGEQIPSLTVKTEQIQQLVPGKRGAQLPDGWQTVVWELDTPVAATDLVALKFEGSETDPTYLDTLRLIPTVTEPFDLSVVQRGRYNRVTWQPPLNADLQTATLYARSFVSDIADPVCEVEFSGERMHCDHAIDERLGTDYLYSFDFGADVAQLTRTDSIIQFQPQGAQFAIGFNADHGAIEYIYNPLSDAVLSTGNLTGSLWMLKFLEEHDMPELRADQFSRSSKTHRFSVNTFPFQLIYDYEENDQDLQLIVEVVALDAQRFDLKARLTNNTGQAIRTVSVPHKLAFETDAIERSLFPIQEGLTLLPAFYEDQRSTMIARPPMFADVLAYEGNTGHLAVHMIQDSRYQSDLLPGHGAEAPLFQPNNIGTGGVGDEGYFQFDMVTYIPDGAQWHAGTMRVSVNRDFREIAHDYRVDNGIDHYPSLRAKLDPFDAFEMLAQSPILAVEMYKSVEWQKVFLGQGWYSIQTDWLDRIPEPGVLHLTHWQKGRDWYDYDHENHKVEDDHPEALPIWWDRYGNEESFLGLLNALETREFLTMPFTNWSVWNTYDPETLEIPELADTPAATTKLRGTDYPFIEYKGYMVKPWRAEVQDRNTRMFETYTNVYPQDLMFVDMTGERSWRYIRMDDGETISAGAYTQAVINENVRLRAFKPLFTEGVFDQIGNSMTGYAQTLQQKFWNQILAHLGTENTHWVTYPFAADVLHDKVAFYQHDLNLEVWPAEDRAFATYYALTGYNYIIDVTKHLNEDEEQIWAMDAIQKSVNARTFGAPLLEVETLTDNHAIRRTAWGEADNPLEIIANFDVDGQETVYALDGFGIAPDGFLARDASNSVIAGVFEEQFNGQRLSVGTHWLTVEFDERQIEIKHPIGARTTLTLERPAAWGDDDQISAELILADKSRAVLAPSMLKVDNDTLDIVLPTEHREQEVRSIVIHYDALAVASQDSAADSEDDLINAVWQLDMAEVAQAVNHNVKWDSTEIGLIATKATFENPSAKFETTPFPIDLSVDPILHVNVADLSVRTELVVQVIEAFGEYRAHDAIRITDSGDYALDVAKIVDATDPNPYVLAMWLEGPQAQAVFDSVYLESEVDVAPPQVISWEERFDDDLDLWPVDNLNVTLAQSNVAITVADQDIGYGKIESTPFLIDIAQTPILTIDITQIQSGTAFSLTIQEQYDDYTAIDLRRDVIGTEPFEVDLREFVDVSGAHPYRLIIWVSGTGMVQLDTISVSSSEPEVPR